MIPALRDEDDDCRAWARWSRRGLRPLIGYPSRWPVPDAPSDAPIERDRAADDAERSRERTDDAERGAKVEAIFARWLARYRDGGDLRAKARFRLLRAAYLIGHDVGWMSLREALWALKREKEADREREIRAQQALDQPTASAMPQAATG